MKIRTVATAALTLAGAGLHPGHHHPRPGRTVPFYPGMPMTVALADPPHALVLWLVTSANKAIDPTGPWGPEYVAWSWAFVLEPVDATTTRLLTRMRITYRPTAKWAPYVQLVLEPAHFVMGRRQLLGLRRRAEATGDDAVARQLVAAGSD